MNDKLKKKEKSVMNTIFLILSLTFTHTYFTLYKWIVLSDEKASVIKKLFLAFLKKEFKK